MEINHATDTISTTGTITISGIINATGGLQNNGVAPITANSADILTNKSIDGASNTVSNIDLNNNTTSTLNANKGGTGQSVYAIGDILYANTTSTLAKLNDAATGNALISGGLNVAPAWGKIGLTTHVSGTLSISNGGTGSTTAISAFDALSPTTTKGDIIVSDGTNNIRIGVGANNLVINADSAQASGLKYDYPLPKSAFVSATGTVTTTSTTDVLLTGMTTSFPSTGLFLVLFNAGQTFNSTNSRQNIFTVYNNGSAVTDSTRIVGNSSANTDINSVSSNTIISGTQGQTVEVRWRVSNNTGTCGNRSLTLIKVQ